MTEQQLPKVFAKDLSNLFALTAWAEGVQLYGSYSMRRPDLGKMRRCDYCRKRRREFGPKCCNHAYAKREDGTERVNASLLSKSFVKKFRHKKHGQSKPWKISQLTARMQADPNLVEVAAKEMHVKKPEVAAIPSFAERFFLWNQERCDKVVRMQSKRSRRINQCA